MKTERNSELYTLIFIFLPSFSCLALPIEHFLKGSNPCDITYNKYIYIYI